MIKLSKPIIVEGKYDKINLENIIDTLIISTDGFGIFKNKEKCKMIRNLAKKNNGIIVMTDSDSAGSMIRAYLKKIIGDSPIINVYIPCLLGKEKRKSTGSKEGFLGVEGMSKEVILDCLKRSGITEEKSIQKERIITKTDMFEVGLSGAKESAQKRREFLKYLNLPVNLTTNAMLDVINNMLSYAEFVYAIDNCFKKEEKN